jgi:phage gp36-like protein
MTAFATKTDMLDRFGEREVIALTDRDSAGEVDDTVLQRALDGADAEISGYIVSRYPAPLPSVPRMLVDVACDIARYRLTGTDVMCTDDIQQRYDYALKYLTKVGRGEISLGIESDGAPAGGVPATSGVKTTAGARRFNAASLEDY